MHDSHFSNVAVPTQSFTRYDLKLPLFQNGEHLSLQVAHTWQARFKIWTTCVDAVNYVDVNSTFQMKITWYKTQYSNMRAKSTKQI